MPPCRSSVSWMASIRSSRARDEGRVGLDRARCLAGEEAPAEIDIAVRDDAARLRRQHDDAGGEEQRFLDRWVISSTPVVGSPPDGQQQFLHALARQRIERAERLVHQQEFRFGGQRAGDADALAHAAGQLPDAPCRPAPRSPTSASSSSARPRRSARPTPRSRSGKATLSRAVSQGNSASSWNTTARSATRTGDRLAVDA